MSLAPLQIGSGAFAAFTAELIAAGLPVSDLAADQAEYFTFQYQSDEALAFVGLIRFGSDALLRSLVVPSAQRGKSNGQWAIEALSKQVRQQGIQRLWLLTTDAERYFIRQGFRIVHRDRAPAAIATSRQFSSTCPDTAVLMCLTLA
jgi:amino-acid N-acetyltransferase